MRGFWIIINIEEVNTFNFLFGGGENEKFKMAIINYGITHTTTSSSSHLISSIVLMRHFENLSASTERTHKRKEIKERSFLFIYLYCFVLQYSFLIIFGQTIDLLPFPIWFCPHDSDTHNFNFLYILHQLFIYTTLI